MGDDDLLAERFEASRRHLRAVAYRMLGSRSEADDAVQEAWFRLRRSDTSNIGNLGSWLTTVVGRVCLDMLRSRKSRKEQALDSDAAETIPSDAPSVEEEAVLADSVGLALLVVLETLTPAERVSFVLHDMFDLPFDEIAPIVGRSPMAARQLASRARRQVQGKAATPEADRDRRREVVNAFLAASRGGDFEALLALLDPDVVFRADAAAVAASLARQPQGAPLFRPEVRGGAAVAQTFVGRAQAARPALIDGVPGLVWGPGGEPRVVFILGIEGGKIVAIDLIADPDHLRRLDVTVVGD